MSAAHKLLRRQWWASRTPAERAEHAAKCAAGRKRNAAERAEKQVAKQGAPNAP